MSYQSSGQTDATPNSMLLVVMNLLVAIATVIYNGLSQALPIGTATNAEIANRLPIYFFPANVTFSIWGIIFLGLIAFGVYQALPAQRNNPYVKAIGPWLILSSVGNVGWLLTFQFENFGLALIPIVILLVTLGIAYVQIRKVDATPTIWDRLFIFAPISIYFAWSAVATVASTTYFLYAASDLTPTATWLGIDQALWGTIILVVTGAITTAVAYLNRDLVYMAVVVWAFAGIIIRYPNVTEVAVAAGAMALLGTVAVIASLFLSNQQSALSRTA